MALLAVMGGGLGSLRAQPADDGDEVRRGAVQAAACAAARVVSGPVRDGGPAATLLAGPRTLRVRTSYLNGRDGYQGPQSHISLRLALPCLTPVVGPDPRYFGKGWGTIVLIEVQAMTPEQRYGQILLDSLRSVYSTPLKHDREYEENERLANAAGFQMFDVNVGSGNYYYKKGKASRFLLDCHLFSIFPAPSCKVRELYLDYLLVDYDYGRDLIKFDLSWSEQIDFAVRSFLAAGLVPQ